MHAYNVSHGVRHGPLRRRACAGEPCYAGGFSRPHTLETDVLSSAQIALASTSAKTVACVVAYPHEVLRARFQTQHHLASLGLNQGALHSTVLSACKGIYQVRNRSAL